MNLYYKSIKNAGFTLVELMIVFFIVVIIAAVAIPNLRSSQATTLVGTYADQIVGAFSFARTEAVTRNKTVTICARHTGRDDPIPSTTLCSDDSSAWADGWIIFHDLDNDGTIESADGDVILREQQPLKGIIEIATANSEFDYRASGEVSATQSFTLKDPDYCTGNQKRAIKISAAGFADSKAVSCP